MVRNIMTAVYFFPLVAIYLLISFPAATASDNQIDQDSNVDIDMNMNNNNMQTASSKDAVSFVQGVERLRPSQTQNEDKVEHDKPEVHPQGNVNATERYERNLPESSYGDLCTGSATKKSNVCCDAENFVFLGEKGGCSTLRDFGACFRFPFVSYKCPRVCNRCDGERKMSFPEYKRRTDQIETDQNGRLKECCIRNGVDAHCAGACHFKTTALQLLAKGQQCLRHLGTLVTCAAGSRDNRDCCKFYFVPPYCGDIFCRGGHFPPRLVSKMLKCVPTTQFVFTCHKAHF